MPVENGIIDATLMQARHLPVSVVEAMLGCVAATIVRKADALRPFLDRHTELGRLRLT